MAAVIICSDFGASRNEVSHCFHCFPIYLPWSDGTNAMIFIFWMWSLSLMFHSPLSLSSSGSLVPLHFLPWGWCHLYIWGYWYFSQKSWFQLVLHSVGHFACCTQHMTMKGDNERLLLDHTKMPGFLVSGGEEFNPGPEMRLVHSELLHKNSLQIQKKKRKKKKKFY